MPKDVTILSNVALNDIATSGATSQVGEPSVATNGSKLFVTGNWYASRSMDSGANWTYVNPYTTTPSAAGGFCCDQLALYDPSRKIWIWIKQYLKTTAGSNVFRIAISKDADFSTGGWYWWDIAPSTLNSDWTDVWFDYPDAALSADHLYVTFNIFNGSDVWQRATVMRFPLDTLESGESLGFGWWDTTDNGALRLTQSANPTGSMYFVDHASFSTLRLFSWPDNSGNISSWDIGVDSWNANIASTAPNGVNWLARCDSRVTAASLGGGEIAVMWTAGAGGNRPHAYCRAVRIKESNKTVINQPDLWSDAGAWAYPACSHNSAGILGFAAYFGGGSRHPGHIVGCHDKGINSWAVRYSRLGSHSPDEGKWGDYINVRADVPNKAGWVASGLTQEGGETLNEVLPRVVRFGTVGTLPITRVVDGFGYSIGGWRVNMHPRFMADTTGDGRADIVGFGNAGVYVSRAQADGSFSAPQLVVGNFGYNAGGWRVNMHPRFMADTTGDGRADIVGFGNAGVYVSRAQANGTFAPIELEVANFGHGAGGWSVDRHPRLMADTTGNGRADIVGFGNAGVYVSRADGTGNYGPLELLVNNFGYGAGGWRVDKHPRIMADTTGDGRADIVGFGNAGVYVSRAQANGTFSAPDLVVENFGYGAGDWRTHMHPRMLADVTGDGRADIVGFGNAGVWVSLAQPNGNYSQPQLVVDNFGYNAGGWRVNMHPRFMADTTGDGRADIVGFGNAGVYVATSRGDGTFNNPVLVAEQFGYNAGDWRVNMHPRFMADTNGDGRADIVGFGNAGVYVGITL